MQPHYDDNDIAIGGTLCRLADAGAVITYLTVTDDLVGVLDPALLPAEATEQLRAEQHEAGVIVGVAEQRWLDWPDAGRIDIVTLRDQIVGVMREVQPEIVLTCDPWLAYETHRDHIQTGSATLEAAMMAGLARLAVSGAPWNVPTVGLYFAGEPNAVIDTSSVQERRHRALDAYRAQFDADGLAGLHAVLDRHESAQAPVGATHGEALRIMPSGALHCGVRPLRRPASGGAFIDDRGATP